MTRESAVSGAMNGGGAVAQQMYSHMQRNIFGDDDEDEGPSHDTIVSFH